MRNRLKKIKSNPEKELGKEISKFQRSLKIWLVQRVKQNREKQNNNKLN